MSARPRPNMPRLLGARIEAIGGVPIAEAIRRVVGARLSRQ